MTSLNLSLHPQPLNLPTTDLNGSSGGAIQDALEITGQLNQQLQAMLSTLTQDPSTGTAGAAGELSTAAVNDGKYVALDQYSQASDHSDLAKWANLASPGQGVSLERPLAAMQILTGKASSDGQLPTETQKAAAMQFVNNNPSLRTALQNTGALNSDGTIDTTKMRSFMVEVSTNLDQANSDIKDYMNKHPDADADSVNIERSAGLLRAYNAIAGESEGHKSNGKNGNNYTHGGKNGGGLTTQRQVEDLQRNSSFGSALKSAARALGSNGGIDLLDRDGDDKATTKADQIYSTNNLDHFLSGDAPSTLAGSQRLLLDASLQNIAGGTDISQLNSDIFQNAQNYTPQQKAAVMVKLMETLVDVQAGGSDDLRNVGTTVTALQQSIQKLASDPATAVYLQQMVPPEMQTMSDEFRGAGGVTSAGSGADNNTGVAAGDTRSASSDQKVSNAIDDLHHGLNYAKTAMQTLRDLAKGEGFMEIGGDSAAAETGVAAAGGVEGAVGAEAAEGAAAGVEGGVTIGEGVLGTVGSVMAVAAPVVGAAGALVGVAGIIFLIVEAVKKHNDQMAFASNVNPTLQQFGIPLPS